LDERQRKCSFPKLSINDFNIIKVIGTGSFGKVLLVTKKDNSCVLAMKILKKKQMIVKDKILSTKNERKILELLDHPFLLQLRYAFQNERKLYLLTDYCAGGELYFHIDKVGNFNEGAVKFYAAQMVLALEYLHSMKIVYKDLKPENVLINNDGYIRIADFGLSEMNSGQLLENSSFCGTAEYISPEQILNNESGFVSDWWSLGIIVYEMVVGRPPFISKDPDTLFKTILQGNYCIPSYLSPEASDFIKRLLCGKPCKRLGFNGAFEIKTHPFLKEIDFDLLISKKLKPPFIPRIKSACDTKYIDNDFIGMEAVDSVKSNDIINSMDDPFLDSPFSFNSLVDTKIDVDGFTDFKEGTNKRAPEEMKNSNKANSRLCLKEQNKKKTSSSFDRLDTEEHSEITFNSVDLHSD